MSLDKRVVELTLANTLSAVTGVPVDDDGISVECELSHVLEHLARRDGAKRDGGFAFDFTPPPVPCAGCGEPTPYAVGDGESYGEFRLTGLGYAYYRTHRDRACVLAMRERVGGTTYTPPLPPGHETAAEGRNFSHASHGVE
jgi:hypothetical protein